MLLMHVGMSSEWGLNKCFARGKLAVCRGELSNVSEVDFGLSGLLMHVGFILGPGSSRPGFIVHGCFHPGLPCKGGHMKDLGSTLLSIKGGHAAPHYIL